MFHGVLGEKTGKPMIVRSGSLASPRVAWSAVTVYGALLTYFLLAPHPLWMFGLAGHAVEQAVDRTVVGYVQHGLTYALLAWLLVWASRTTSRSPHVAWCLLALGHGIVTEWLQTFIPERCSDWPDGLANTLAVGLGWLSAILILRIVTRTPAKATEPLHRAETTISE